MKCDVSEQAAFGIKSKLEMGSLVRDHHDGLIANKTGNWTCYVDKGLAGHSFAFNGDSMEICGDSWKHSGPFKFVQDTNMDNFLRNLRKSRNTILNCRGGIT